jgi:hypothetical protein
MDLIKIRWVLEVAVMEGSLQVNSQDREVEVVNKEKVFKGAAAALLKKKKTPLGIRKAKRKWEEAALQIYMT